MKKTLSLLSAVALFASCQQREQHCIVWMDQYALNGTTIEKQDEMQVLYLGDQDGYYDLTPETGVLVQSLHDFTVSTYFKVEGSNPLDGYGHFLFAFSNLEENKADEGPYMAMRLNEQRFETSTGGWEHEEIVMQGGKPERDVWIHALFRQSGKTGELFLDGQLIGKNENMPILAETFKEAPAYCWIGRAPFHGDKFLSMTYVADFRIYEYAISDDELADLVDRKSLLK